MVICDVMDGGQMLGSFRATPRGDWDIHIAAGFREVLGANPALRLYRVHPTDGFLKVFPDLQEEIRLGFWSRDEAGA